MGLFRGCLIALPFALLFWAIVIGGVILACHANLGG